MFANAHLRAARRDRSLLAGSLVALSVVAWLSLGVWGASPYATFLRHDADTGPVVMRAALFTSGWFLMIVAMMLPSSVPLVVTFAAIVGRRRRPGLLVALLLAGYLVIWSAVGLGAWALDRGLHGVVDAVPWLEAYPQLILGAILLAAGLWQLSPLRERCLDQCRSPLGFVMDHWHGVAERRESLWMGVTHGVFCIGCCWSLMLVMLGVGMASLPLMLGLGAVAAVERNLPWGRRLTRPVGGTLIVAALYVVAA